MPAKRNWGLLLPLLLLALPVQPATKVGNVTPTRNLALGRFVAAGGGTVVVNPAGVRSKSGAVVLLSGGTVSSAAFSLTESGSGKSVTWTTISLPASATLTNGSGASMTLTNFTSNPTGTFSGSALTQLTVGATLNVGPNQSTGNYSGTFVVTVNYQ
ncbi:MAG: hypothetical protein JWQ01_1364 [Massilia sp.]|jgi:hypothetical protein|nr:hypothetical protein [Massilia sp.]